MNFTFIRHFDRWLGLPLLLLVVPVARGLAALLPRRGTDQMLSAQTEHCVFLKLKGGGSLIVALPALLAMRKLAPKAEFTLVCTLETKIYAELTGVFDRYAVIDDTGMGAMVRSTFNALRQCLRTETVIDLEPNSILAAAFTVLTMAEHRVGFVKSRERWRAAAYSQALSFNIYAPIYIYYDQLVKLVNSFPVTIKESQTQLLRHITPDAVTPDVDNVTVLGLAPFTSDFARERMMPVEVWGRLLRVKIETGQVRLVLFGSPKNKSAGELFVSRMRQYFPQTETINLCGTISLAEAAGTIMAVHEFWAIDSGLLHIARLLGVACRSFWGPTQPSQRLRPIEGLQEVTFYRNFVCSPCVHANGAPPCGGNNQCMMSMAETSPDTAPVWPVKVFGV
jgi:ADP-heptose:LPS heptosyltransferase